MDDLIDFQDLASGGDDQVPIVDDSGSGFDFNGASLGSFTPPNLGSLVGGGSFQPIQYQPTAGSLGGFAAGAGALALTLGGRLAAMFGRGAGKAVINGVTFSMSRLWPYIRKYGPGAVAGALGITLGQLGALAMNAPQHPTRRRRGISAADISRTKRVIRFNRRLTRQLGLGGGGRRSYRRRPAYYC